MGWSIREKIFFAVEMITISRSKGMDNVFFFDKYYNNTTGIKNFVVNSQEALKK